MRGLAHGVCLLSSVLQVLVLIGLGLQSLDSAEELRSLKALFLQDLPIERVPDCIGTLTSLVLLHLFRLDLASPLPETMANLTTLRILTCCDALRESPAIEHLVTASEGKLSVWTLPGGSDFRRVDVIIPHVR